MATADIADPPARHGRPGPRIASRKVIKWTVGALIAIGAVGFGFYYWWSHRLYVSTDDAYVNANITEIAAQVTGPVVKLYASDQQKVQAGQPLFDIDPAPYQHAVNKAESELEVARQTASERSAAVVAARATLAQRQAELRNARSNSARNTALMERGIVSRQNAENVQTQASTAEAAVKAAEANVVQAQSALGKSGAENAGVQAAAAELANARLDLERTHVTAPVSGTIANLTLRPGSVVQPGVPLFAIIGEQEYWVDANFKETQLNRLRPNQSATVKVDMYPGHEFKAVVQSVSGGSGTAFSLLPPQNATGNWVKVTQRVPVRVRILDPDPQYPLRVGTTATVDVKVQ
jgi:membrane fusion protein (multidrug efflux system)